MILNPHAFDKLIAAYCGSLSLSIPLARAVIQQESGWDALAVGDSGAALGLMQTHRIAAEDVGMAAYWDSLQAAIEAKDTATAAQLGLQIGTAYLARMLTQFQGNEAFALAAYNQGPTVIAAAKRYAEMVLALKGKA